MSGAASRKLPVDVICQHTKEGSIIPLKVRLMDDDGEYQIFWIKGYKELAHPGEEHMPNGIGSANHIWRFECKIAVFGTERRILLFYNAYENQWRLDYIG